jgi:hypothetical protein
VCSEFYQVGLCRLARPVGHDAQEYVCCFRVDGVGGCGQHSPEGSVRVVIDGKERPYALRKRFGIFEQGQAVTSCLIGQFGREEVSGMSQKG